MKKFMIAAIIAGAALSWGAATSTAGAEAAKLSADSTVGELLDNPKAKEVLTKHLPDVVANPQMEMARAMTLRSLQQYSPDAITDDKLKAIDTDLAKAVK